MRCTHRATSNKVRHGSRQPPAFHICSKRPVSYARVKSTADCSHGSTERVQQILFGNNSSNSRFEGASTAVVRYFTPS